MAVALCVATIGFGWGCGRGTNQTPHSGSSGPSGPASPEVVKPVETSPVDSKPDAQPSVPVAKPNVPVEKPVVVSTSPTIPVVKAPAAASSTVHLELRQAVTIYLNNEAGADFVIRMQWRDESQGDADRPRLIRVFDPAENLILRRDEAGEKTKGRIPDYKIDLPITGRGAGVYQVIVTGFGGSLDFSTTPGLGWGVMGYPRLAGRGEEFKSTYFFVPGGGVDLPVRCEVKGEGCKVIDERGATRLEVKGANAGGTVGIRSEAGKIWKMAMGGAADFRLDFGGVPIILCSDEKTAKAVHGGVDVLEDGTICFHKFQVKAQELLKKFRQMPREVFAVQVPVLERYKEQWLANAGRNDLLLGGSGVYAALPVILKEQNLDQASPWFGTFGKPAVGSGAKEGPSNSLNRLGLTRVAEHVAILAAVYSIDQPFNPLHHDAGLQSRIIIAALQELMLLREHEMPMDLVPDGYFGGERAFAFASFLRSYPLAVKDCPAVVKEVWTEGLRRYVDHESISQVASAVNQWTFLMLGVQHFLDGSGDETYRAVNQRNLRWLYTRNQWDMGQMQAGYFCESGPDATYNGITLHNLAWLYKQTKDATLLEAIERCVDLFNHTIAPQADGTLLGVSSFCTRTPGNWTQPQYGGGVAMLADVLPEATPLADRVWPTERTLKQDLVSRRSVEQAVGVRLNYLDDAVLKNADSVQSIGFGPEIQFAIWEHFGAVPRKGELPMVAERDFTRNFGDEFFCVRRPSYYTFIYAGKPDPEWRKTERPTDARKQHARNGGGLCMFWSPLFGSSVMAQNWSAYAAQTIIAERDSVGGGCAGGGGADWEDYWSVSNTFDAERGEATVKGTLRDQPIDFERKYRFLRDRVVCEVTVGAAKACEYKAMWECFPFPSDPKVGLKVSLVDEEGRPVTNRPASAIVFRNGSIEAHVIVFAKPRRCEVGADRSVDHYEKTHEYGRVLAELPGRWTAGQREKVKWTMLAVTADQVAAAVKEAIAAMGG